MTPAYTIELVELTLQTTLVVRARCAPEALGRKLGEMLPAILGVVRARGLRLGGAPFTRYLAMDAGMFEIEAGLPVLESLPAGTEEATPSGVTVLVSALPAGPAATTVHEGPYQQLGAAHEALRGWAQANGHTAAGGGWESYVSDPAEEPDPSKWRTAVFLPLVRPS